MKLKKEKLYLTVTVMIITSALTALDSPGFLAVPELKSPQSEVIATKTNGGKKTEEPWRLSQALGFPKWLLLGLNHRSRYENLTNQFRTGYSGDQPIYAMRTLLSPEAKWTNWRLRTEFIDSRIYFSTPGTPLDTTFVNAFDLLQGFAEVKVPALFATQDELRLRGGRFTMDIGSRRLVARNRFRNTINAFTGIDSEYKFASDDRILVFATLPVQRLPDNLSDLQANKSKLDYETQRVMFGGVYYENRSVIKSVVGEFYSLGLSEEDTPDLLTRNRRLITPGMRVYISPKPQAPDFEIESALQTGYSRLTTKATEITDLRHLAFFGHASLGYTFRILGQTRFSLEYQYASGNSASDTSKNSRFDPLFGARRGMFGPTNLYGAIALSNISTPGVRLEFKPSASVRTFIAYRYVQLADTSDTWTTAGVTDKSSNSGAFLGQQIEGELIWHILPGNISLEVGFAYFSTGSFLLNTKPGMQDPFYVFTGFVFEI